MGQTETRVAQVTLKSENDKNKTISIDRPKDNLTLNQIKTAFQPAISGGWLLDNYGDTIVEVSEAKYNQVIKTSINGEPVVVSPSSLEFNIGSETAVGTYVESTVTVSNAFIVSAGIDNLDVNGVSPVVYVPNAKTSVRIRMYRKNQYALSLHNCNLKINFGENSIVTVPIKVSQTNL